jgi:hypothetical protein
MSRTKLAFVVLFLLTLMASAATAQMKPEELGPDFVVKLVLKDSSQFYATILARPTPDRVFAETRNGRLEIPLKDIEYALDYRFNFVLKDDLRTIAIKNAADNANYKVARFLSRPKLPDISTVYTKDLDVFRGHRYLFDDTAHVILSTAYGNLYFKYPKLDKIENFSGSNDTREDFFTTTYLVARDPRTSQGFITPNARAFGDSNMFIADYMLAGLQFNYGPTNWLSLNAGGVFAPFLPTQITVGTAGFKITPYQSSLFTIAVGAQGVYSEVVKITRIGFPYAVVTYGTWEGELSILAGVSYKREDDSNMHPYTKANPLLAIDGDLRVGENLKAGIELFFINDFEIIPVLFSLRYFQNNLTIDAGVVFSLYKPGAARTTKTLGEYVFNASIGVIPLVSASFHF